jgi:hypothetical protein
MSDLQFFIAFGLWLVTIVMFDIRITRMERRYENEKAAKVTKRHTSY